MIIIHIRVIAQNLISIIYNYKYRMGAASSQKNSELYSVLKPMNWQKQHYLGQGELVRDIQSGLKGELYSIYLNNIQSQIPIYQFRKDNPHYIVTVHSIEQANQQFLCTGSESVRVVTQRIPFRLGDLGNVGYAQGLYILQCALKGAQLINNRYLFSYSTKNMDESARYVQYTLNSICFTEIGEAKIWVNEDIAFNSPPASQNGLHSSNSKNILQALNIQKRTAQQIMTLIEERMSGNKFNNYLQVKKQQYQQLIDFENCIDFVLRMRAIEEGQSEAVRNIILPSMLMKSMSSNNNLNKSQFEERQTGILQSKQTAQPTYTYNIISERLNSKRTSQNPIQRMENTITSTSSVSGADIDINKFAVPPRPPRKSRSRSKQRPTSRNASQEKQKPNIVINLSNNNQRPYPNASVQNSHQFNKSGPAPSINNTNTYFQPNIVQNTELRSQNSPQHSGSMNPTGQIIINPSIQPTKNPFSQPHPNSGFNGFTGLSINNLNGPTQTYFNNGVSGETYLSKKITDNRPIQNNDKPRSPFKQITTQTDKKYTNTGVIPQQSHQTTQNISNYIEANSTPISSPKFTKKSSANVVNFTTTNPNSTMSFNSNGIYSNPMSPFGKIVPPYTGVGSAKPTVTFNTTSKPENLGNFAFQGNANSTSNGIGSQQNTKKYTNPNPIQTQAPKQLKKNSSKTDYYRNIDNKNVLQKTENKVTPAEMLSNYNNKYGINSNTNNISYGQNGSTKILNGPAYNFNNTGSYNYPNTITINNNKVNFSSTPVYAYAPSSKSIAPTYLQSNTVNTNNTFSVSSNPNYTSIPVLPLHYTHIPSNQFKIIEQKINSVLSTSQNMNLSPHSASKAYTSNNATTPQNSNSYLFANTSNPITSNKQVELKESQASQYSIEASIEQI